MNLKNFYSQQERTLAIEITQLKKYNSIFAGLELLTFLFAVACVVVERVWSVTPVFYVCAVSFLCVYFLIRRRDERNDRQIESCESRRNVYQKELGYLDGDFSCFENGNQYVNPYHPYTFDMDVFGKDSLFNRINRTITTGGSDWLATCLSRGNLHGGIDKESVCLSKDEICERQAAIRELADREPLRTSFLSHGKDGIMDTGSIRRFLLDICTVNVPRFFTGSLPFTFAYLAVTCLLFTVIGAMMGYVNSNIPIFWGMFQYFVVYLMCLRPLRMIRKTVSNVHEQMRGYIKNVVLISESNLNSKELVLIRRQLTGKKNNAIASFKELERILDGLDRRGNVLGQFFFNAFFLSDYFLVLRFLEWQKRYTASMEGWLAAVSHFDALVSMATFYYNEPAAVEAEIVDSDALVYETVGLCHPFLGASAVRNDFTLDSGHYYIVTGANMAGKSTFLRALGVNYILAMCGMPVFASRLRVSIFSLFSSMRTTDNLSHEFFTN